jgi:2',5'-phosphodiesterase
MKKPVDIWDNIMYRSNQMICTKLTSRSLEKEIVVGNYHMPCMFDLTPVMVAHCALSAQHIARYAGGSVPYIYCGDFNIKPPSTEYKLLTEGRLDSKVRK